MEETIERSPSSPPAPHLVLLAWSDAHSRLILEEGRLVELCRRLGKGGITAVDVDAQREWVTRLRELSDALYQDAIQCLGGFAF